MMNFKIQNPNLKINPKSEIQTSKPFGIWKLVIGICFGSWILIFGFLFSICIADTRQPAVSGMFYPEDKIELAKQIQGYLAKVGSPKIKGQLIALVVPHAGYDYSGQVAAYAYKELEGRKFKRVILIGASHHIRFDGISIGEFDYYETPLGSVEVDREFCNELVKCGGKLGFIREAHLKEHALEVQLPFLQTVLGNDFKIVPLIFGEASFKNSRFLAFSLARLIDDQTLIICSTDWSHYHDYETAQKMDQQGIRAVLDGDIKLFAELLATGSTEACAAPAVITTMLVAPAMGVNKVELLNCANSGDVTGDTLKVVGYAAIAYAYESSPLSKADQERLLKIARGALEENLNGNDLPELKETEGVLAEKRGAFVTLTRDRMLRGCIGYIQAYKPLAEIVQEMAVAAATNDSRFLPVNKDELSEIEIEISVLSRLQRVHDVEEIEIGRDGLYIIKDNRGGLLLPQVATENKWNRKQFLENVCYKAGLPKDAWQDDDILLYRYSAQVFHE